VCVSICKKTGEYLQNYRAAIPGSEDGWLFSREDRQVFSPEFCYGALGLESVNQGEIDLAPGDECLEGTIALSQLKMRVHRISRLGASPGFFRMNRG